MWLCVIFLYLSFSTICAEENITEIKLNVFRGEGDHLQCNKTELSIELKTPLRVFVNYSEKIYRPRCYKYGSPSKIIVTQEFWNKHMLHGYYSSNIAFDEAGMKQFECTFHTKPCVVKHKPSCHYVDYAKNVYLEDMGVKCLAEVFVQSTFDETNKKTGMVAGASVAAAAVAAAGLWTAARLRRRRATHMDDSDYQNLPQHKEGPMPTPAQWNAHRDDCASHTAPHDGSIDNLYSKPIPKIERSQKNEPAHAHAQGSTNCEPTYASVHSCEEPPVSVRINEEPTYAEVGENCVYQNLDEIRRSEEQLIYAEIVPAGSTADRGFAPKNENYVRVMYKGREDPNCDNVAKLTPQYGNFFRDEEYANVNASDEYAEPAYCEVIITKK